MNKIPSPCLAIASFYDCWGLPDAIHILANSLKAAQANRLWKGRTPSNLIYFYDRLGLLLRSAIDLLREEEVCRNAKLTGTHSQQWLTAYESYCSPSNNYTAWHFLPRHLTQKEFVNPCKVFQKIKNHRSVEKWKERLKDLMMHALSHNNMQGFISGGEVLNSWLLLHKLLEATHLVYVRAIPEDEDGPLRKWQPVTVSNEKCDGRQDRSNMTFLYEQLKQLLKHVDILQQQQHT